MRRVGIQLIFILFLISCGNDVPDDVLPPEKMQVVMTDMLLAEGFAENFLVMDSSKKREDWFAQEYSKVIAIHKISQEQFRNSLKYYKKHPELFKEVIDTVYQRGQRMRDQGYQRANSKTKAVE